MVGKRNILILHITTFFSSLYFYHQIVTLYLMDKGLSFFEINSLFGVILVTQTICEIPTGIIADKIGRKKSIIIAFIFQLLGEVEFIFADNYLLFAISTILAGIGFSFYSGCYEAMMYDSLKIDQRAHEMKKIAGLNTGFKQLAIVTGALIGGFFTADLAMSNFTFVIILTAISVSIALIVSFFLKEPAEKFARNTQNSVSILKEGFRLISNNSSLRRIVMLSILATPFIIYLMNFYQPYLLEAKVPGIWLGISLSIASFMGFFTGKYAYRMEEIFGVQYGLFISTILPGIFYLLMAFILNNYLSVILFILAFASMNIQQPVFADYKNRHIKSSIRATTLSMISMLSGIYVAMMGLFIGKLADIRLNHAFMLMGGMIIISVVLIQIREKHVKNTGQEEANRLYK